jgi:hypothetical protein
MIADEGGGGPVTYDTGDAGNYDLNCTGVANTPELAGVFSDGSGYWVVWVADGDVAYLSEATPSSFDSTFDYNQSTVTTSGGSPPGAPDEIYVRYYSTAAAAESEFNNYSYNSANNIGDIAAYTPDLSAIHITSGPDAGDNNDAP